MPIFRFLPPMPSLDATGVIDILVVAFLVYQCLMVVRGTRAGPILLGILIMVLLYILALWTGLEALRTLLSFIVPFMGLAVIVLFQSEIRRALARLGRKRWLGLGGEFRGPDIGEIMLAAEQFMEKKTGALIVLERDIGLRTFIESGVRLDASLSRDLLLSIFQPGLPLHDGAVIVQNNSIAAAACFLPLTTNPMLSRKLGTRHRAAIGITEETDCLSLVVSEETGRLSLAAYGELIQGLSVAEVAARIDRHFGVRRPGAVQIDEFPADIPLSQAPGAIPADNRPERVNLP
ncbi:MAG TPA: diadenylate cyclase CdaA [Candidatus Sulfopaludibacter sp.]|nr:diadenylate cyclase CdaA [Candidatus Sulfopaludibacter sp.]